MTAPCARCHRERLIASRKHGMCNSCDQYRMRQARPIAICRQCGGEFRPYAKGLCQWCYERPGQAKKYLKTPRYHRFCIICLSSFLTEVGGNSRCCSQSCRGIFLTIKAGNYSATRTGTCDHCGKRRHIRARGMCGACYVLARLYLSDHGIGRCPIRVNKLKGTVGVSA